jgi:hypothetical protein
MRCEAAAGVPELSAELSQDCLDIRDNFESDSTRGLFKIATVSEMTGLNFYVVDFTSTACLIFNRTVRERMRHDNLGQGLDQSTIIHVFNIIYIMPSVRREARGGPGS